MPVCQSLNTPASRWRRRSESEIAAISMILPSDTVKPMIVTSWPPSKITAPAAPFTNAGRTTAEGRAKVIAPRATAVAPRTTRETAERTAPPSDRSTMSGWSTATSASKSPPRAAAKKASTTARCRVKSLSGPVWRRAPDGAPDLRAAAWRPANGPSSQRSGRTAHRTCHGAQTPTAREVKVCRVSQARRLSISFVSDRLRRSHTS